MMQTDFQDVDIEKLIPYARNAKKHPAEQIEKLKNSIKEFGFVSPVLIDKDFNIIAGHGRVIAAKELGLEKVPAVFIEGLTDDQRRAYILVDNKLTELGGWDYLVLDQELFDLEAKYDMEDFGFDEAGINFENIDELFSQEEKAEKKQKMYICPHCGKRFSV